MYNRSLWVCLHDELVGLADSGGDPSDGAPGVHDRLASGEGAAGLQGAVLEAPHDLETGAMTLEWGTIKPSLFEQHAINPYLLKCIV